MAAKVSDRDRFDAEDAERALRAACAIAGLSSADAVPMRLGENALFHLPAAALVVRIARTMDYWDDAATEVHVSRWLNESGVPAAEAADVPQPIEADGRPVTLWRFIEGRAGKG